MVDPILSKAAAKGLDSVAKQQEQSPAKLGESKFDKVRSRLLDEQAAGVKLPPEVKQVSLEQKKVLQSDLSRRIEQSGPGAAHRAFGVQMKQAKEGIHQLTTRVNALPKTPAFEPFRQRLASIDNQYQAAGRLLNSIHSSSSPGDLMKVQMQMYQLTENLELMSKVVEQVTSGVKTIVQTQV
jgi:hypothetical protein